MSNKTFIPAFRCSVGDWKYYVCKMQYAEVARQVQFAYELESNEELGKLVQRGISDRTQGITEYLLKSKHRFLGALVIAAWGGDPEYTPLAMDDPDGMLKGLDEGFGVLTFDGTQMYFVLDGQHRLRAIKDSLKSNPNLGKEDICVLIVTHYDSSEGRIRTRRLFTNINRNAKQTGAAENIALDEDDAYAVLTRRLVEEHEFLREKGRVRVILSQGEDGELKLASGNVPKTDARALTTFTVLYDVIQYLGFDFASSMRIKTHRPEDDVLETSYRSLTIRINDLLKACGEIQERLESAASAREVRAPKNAEGDGHPFMRPVIQKSISRVASQLMQQKALTWEEFTQRLTSLEWKMSALPWIAVFNAEKGSMVTAKENTDLLNELLRVHIAPSNLQAIRRARKNFKDTMGGKAYPVSEEELATRLPLGDSPALDSNVELPSEISANGD